MAKGCPYRHNGRFCKRSDIVKYAIEGIAEHGARIREETAEIIDGIIDDWVREGEPDDITCQDVVFEYLATISWSAKEEEDEQKQVEEEVKEEQEVKESEHDDPWGSIPEYERRTEEEERNDGWTEGDGWYRGWDGRWRYAQDPQEKEEEQSEGRGVGDGSWAWSSVQRRNSLPEHVSPSRWQSWCEEVPEMPKFEWEDDAEQARPSQQRRASIGVSAQDTQPKQTTADLHFKLLEGLINKVEEIGKSGNKKEERLGDWHKEANLLNGTTAKLQSFDTTPCQDPIKKIKRIVDFQNELKSVIKRTSPNGQRLGDEICECADMLCKQWLCSDRQKVEEKLNELQPIFDEATQALKADTIFYLERLQGLVRTAFPTEVVRDVENLSMNNAFGNIVMMLWWLRREYDLSDRGDRNALKDSVAKPQVRKDFLEHDVKEFWKTWEVVKEMFGKEEKKEKDEEEGGVEGESFTELTSQLFECSNIRYTPMCQLEENLIDGMIKTVDKVAEYVDTLGAARLATAVDDVGLHEYAPQAALMKGLYTKLLGIIKKCNTRGKVPSETRHTPAPTPGVPRAPGKGLGKGGKGKGGNVCYDFQKGQCKRGDSCRYSHDLQARVTEQEQDKNQENEEDADNGEGEVYRTETIKVAGVCRSWLKHGKCEWRQCKFDHPEILKGATKTLHCGKMRRDGKCEFGDKCAFSHDKAHDKDGKSDGAGGKGTRQSHKTEIDVRALEFEQMSAEELETLTEKIMDEVEKKREASGCHVGIDVHAQVYKCEIAGRILWMIDSGANVVVIGSTQDKAVCKLLPRTVTLKTTGGLVPAQLAMIRTPFGIKTGVIVEGSPKIMPEGDLVQHADYHRNKSGLKVTDYKSGKQYQTQVISEVPYLVAEADGGAVEEAAEGDEQVFTAREAADNNEEHDFNVSMTITKEEIDVATHGLAHLIAPVKDPPDVVTRVVVKHNDGSEEIQIGSRPGTVLDVLPQISGIGATQKMVQSLIAAGAKVADLVRHVGNGVTRHAVTTAQEGKGNGRVWQNVMDGFNKAVVDVHEKIVGTTDSDDEEVEWLTGMSTEDEEQDEQVQDEREQGELGDEEEAASEMSNSSSSRCKRRRGNNSIIYKMTVLMTFLICGQCLEGNPRDSAPWIVNKTFRHQEGEIAVKGLHVVKQKVVKTWLEQIGTEFTGEETVQRIANYSAMQEEDIAVWDAGDGSETVVLRRQAQHSVIHKHGKERIQYDKEAHEWGPAVLQAAASTLTKSDRIGRAIVDTNDEYTRMHAGKHHRPYDPRCVICVKAKLRSRQHKRQQVARCGEVCVDLLQLNAGDEYSLVFAHRGNPKITHCERCKNKDTETVRDALAKGLLIMERIWNCPTIIRVHSDGESAIKVLGKERAWAEQGIAFTRTQGGDHQANGGAETAIRILCGDARARILRANNRSARRALLHFALQHACATENAEQTAGNKEVKVKSGDILPFASECIVRGPPAVKVPHLDERGVRAIYLCPDFQVSNGSWVGLLNRENQITKFTAVTKVQAAQHNGGWTFPDVTVQETAKLTALEDVVTVACKACGKERPVKHSQKKKLDKGHFTCDRLQGIDCSTPADGSEGAYDPREALTLRRGRNRRFAVNEMQAHSAQPAVAEASQDEIHAEIKNLDTLFEQEPEWLAEFNPLQEIYMMSLDQDGVSGSANVTRACTKAERESAQGIEAREVEINKICGFDAIGMPREKQEIVEELQQWQQEGKEVKDTESNAMILDHIKFAELAAAKRKNKARLVILGHLLKCMLAGRRVVGKEDLWQPVSGLAGLRMVFAHALVNHFRVLNYDILNAHLNVRDPVEELGRHWLCFPSNIIQALPSQFRNAAAKLQQPRFEMCKAIYGHPLSGYLYIRESLKILRAAGFRQSPFDAAVYVKANVMVSAYVDDNSVSGDDEALAEFERILGGHFPIGSIDENTRILGQNPRRTTTPEKDTIVIDMVAYTEAIIAHYESKHEKEAKAVKAPGTVVLRGKKQGELKEYQADSEHVKSTLAMMLWLARCGRGDIMVSVTNMCARGNSWDDECGTQLRKLVGYLKHTKQENLQLTVVEEDKREQTLETVLYTDANLGVPKSTSGWIMGIRGDKGTWVPTSFTSKQQTITADSTCISEMIACCSGIKETLAAAAFAQEFIVGRKQPIRVWTDNYGLIRITARGSSIAMSVYTKAIGLRMGLLTDLVALQEVVLEHVLSRFNRSDIFTKLMGPIDILAARRQIGIGPDDGIAVHAAVRGSERDSWMIRGNRITRLHFQQRHKLCSSASGIFAPEVARRLGKWKHTLCLFQGGAPAVTRTDARSDEQRLPEAWTCLTVWTWEGDGVAEVVLRDLAGQLGFRV